MIRNIVGSLVYIGAGKHPPPWIDELMASKDRRNAAPTFMPDGLYLSAIEYDPAFGLMEVAGTVSRLFVPDTIFFRSTLRGFRRWCARVTCAGRPGA